MTPYRRQKRSHFWRTALSADVSKTLKDIYNPKLKLTSQSAIATAGSCFAQNIRKHLISNNCNFIDLEPAPPLLSPERRRAYGYSLFSARFGNIYTLEQLNQLAHRAFNLFETREPFWEEGGRVFDPLRPTIEPNGFRSVDEAEASRRVHLRETRRMFEDADCLIFTLGLTETWLSRSDGTVFPLCPGVAAGEFDAGRYRFHNSGVAENIKSFENFFKLVKTRNPRLKVILTVSPVALEATATKEHVINATSYSKAVLRTTAGELSAQHDDVDYFPSYEIFTSPAFRGQFFEANGRDPSADGVSHAMNVFFSSHGLSRAINAPKASIGQLEAEQEEKRFAEQQQLICDEMLLRNENRDL